MTRCPVQRKKKHRSKGAALSYALWSSRKFGSTERPYRCLHCGFWHLSTKPRKVAV